MTARGIHIDKANTLIFGWAVISEIDGQEFFNVHDTHVPANQELLKAAMDYATDRDAKVLMNHTGAPVGELLFAFPVTSEIAAAMGFTSKFNGLLVGIKANETLLAKFEDGTLTGFSPFISGESEVTETIDG